MKRILSSFVLAAFLVGSALAADTVKFTFPDVTYPDGTKGTIVASSKTTRKGTITVCGYYSNPNDKWLGEFQTDEFASRDANLVKEHCLQNYPGNITR